MTNRPADSLRHAAAVAARIFLGCVFIYASIHKLQNPAEFARIIYGYKILPAALINLFAITLPGVELVAGILLVIGVLPSGAALTITASLAVFTVAIGFNLARGLEFDCGCFSFAGSRHGAALDLMLRDVALFALGVWLIATGPGRKERGR